jgi:hypothetical protein
MRKILWPIVVLGIVVWSALAWIANAVIQWGGNIASSNVDQVPVDPETVEMFSWLAIFGTDVLQWMVIAVWGLGVVIALALGFLGQKLLPQFGNLRSKLKV